jgi:hypothetical protein
MFTCCCVFDTYNREEKISNNNNTNITNEQLSGIEMYIQYSKKLSHQSPQISRVNSVKLLPSTYNCSPISPNSPNSPIFTDENLTPESFQRELNNIFSKPIYKKSLENTKQYTAKQKSTFNNLKDTI